MGVLLFAIGAAGVFALLSYFDAHDSSTTSRSASPAEGPGTPDTTAASAPLRAGNIVLEYSAPADEAPLRAIARREAGAAAGDPALLQTGQGVIVRRVAGTNGVLALAWHRSLRAASPASPALDDFVTTYLGQGDG